MIRLRSELRRDGSAFVSIFAWLRRDSASVLLFFPLSNFKISAFAFPW